MTPSSADPRGASWAADEEEAFVNIMKYLVNETELIGGRRWEEGAMLLQKVYNGSRTPSALKNQWNRVLRARTGLDERRRPKPTMMVTGALTPRKKRRAAPKASLVPDLEAIEEDDLEGEEAGAVEVDEEEVVIADVPKSGKRKRSDDKVTGKQLLQPRKRRLRGGAEY